MKSPLLARAIRSCRVSLKLLALGVPANLLAVRRAARLRRVPAETLVRTHAQQTKRHFAAAKKLGSQAIFVVIPCRNEAQHLPSTLVALARNDNVVPIVVDNNSTDRTSKIAKQMGAIVVVEPEGNKMAGTQAGIRCARETFGAERILFLDGDTMPLPRWGAAMDRRLQQLDAGNGAAVFGSTISMFGPSHLANIAATALGLMYTILREQRGEDPIARGGNYGLSFDASGAMEKQLLALKKDLF
ncbi:MAG TPA: glycosyltransferase family A protein, partial [Candidatus Pristimantibacillus sp.]|nr:glycosyltransferase family A protein [Candidatus Pristimantibacillus sp.]